MQTKQTPTEGQNSAKLEAESALRGAACSPSISSGLRDTPITDFYEVWWAEHGDKCETMVRELGVKAAVERGFFGGHERSISTLVKLNPAASNHSEGVLCSMP